MLITMAAMLGPAIAATFSTAPARVPIPSDAAARPIQIAQEIANVRTKKAGSWCRRTSKPADVRSLTIRYASGSGPRRGSIVASGGTWRHRSRLTTMATIAIKAHSAARIQYIRIRSSPVNSPTKNAPAPLIEA